MSTDAIIHRSWTIAQAVADAATLPEGMSASECSSRNDDPWHGGDFDDALRMAVVGDPVDAAKIGPVGTVARIRSARRPYAVWSEAGSTVDVGRYLAGETDNMIETVRGARPSPVLKIAIERAVASDVPDGDIRAVGSSILAVVEALRTGGIPTELWVTLTIENYERQWHGDILVQEAGRPINKHVLAYWLANGTVLRRIGFSLMEHESPADRQAFSFHRGGYYGHPARRDGQGYDETAPSTQYEATEWVADVLRRRLGITIEKG